MRSAGQIGVARAQGEAVGLAHGGRGNDLERQIEVAHHLPDDAELLIVLLAEHGDVGCNLREELAAHRRHAREEVRAESLSSPSAVPAGTMRVAKPAGYIRPASGAQTRSQPTLASLARSPASSRG